MPYLFTGREKKVEESTLSVCICMCMCVCVFLSFSLSLLAYLCLRVAEYSLACSYDSFLGFHVGRARWADCRIGLSIIFLGSRYHLYVVIWFADVLPFTALSLGFNNFFPWFPFCFVLLVIAAERIFDSSRYDIVICVVLSLACTRCGADSAGLHRDILFLPLLRK